MNATAEPLDLRGFVVSGDVPVPVTQVGTDTRDRLVGVVAAIMLGQTPEEVAACLRDGFPPAVCELVEGDLERDELDAHVDVLLHALEAG